MKYIIDIDLLEKEGFNEVAEIIKCYGEPLEERPQGKWVYGNLDHSACSNCNYFNHYGDLPFCPNCGAEMANNGK